MNIIFNEDNIILGTEDGSSHTLFVKPDIADYGNVTTRPLVKSYHLVRETIWERLVRCLKTLEAGSHDDSRLGCYALVFSALYPFLLSDSQAKNILGYGLPDAASFHAALRDFTGFLRKDNCYVPLPHNPSVFSGLADNTWHVAVIELDSCDGLRTVCDAMTKVRTKGTVLLYTAKTAPADEMEPLISLAAKKIRFSSCTLYVYTMDEKLSGILSPCTSEALVLAGAEALLGQVEEIRTFFENTMRGRYDPARCLHTVRQLGQIENTLFAFYDYLEDPLLPVHAGTLKETVMDCHAAMEEQADPQTYLENLAAAACAFFSAVEREFQ